MSLLPLLAACGTGTDTDTGSESHASDGEKTTAGSSGQLDIPADANADLKKQYLLENAIAACMKKQGFTYTPVAPEDPTASWTTDGADYALTKEYRRKYGEGVPQRRCADHVLLRQMRLRRQAFTGLEPTGGDPVPEVIGDGVAS